MGIDDPVLTGGRVRLEPLEESHVLALADAASADVSLYRWSLVPQDVSAVEQYVTAALRARSALTAVPFVIIRLDDAAVIGSTRFFNLERWAWPPGHARHGRQNPDICEIGYTWLAGSAVRTAANTEAKLLMLSYAFETWGVLSVCFYTDERNLRSRAALERIGAKYDGTLRAHRMGSDYTARNSARYSILEAEWPDVKQHLQQLLIARS